jgi:hypothetical protein
VDALSEALAELSREIAKGEMAQSGGRNESVLAAG